MPHASSRLRRGGEGASGVERKHISLWSAVRMGGGWLSARADKGQVSRISKVVNAGAPEGLRRQAGCGAWLTGTGSGRVGARRSTGEATQDLVERREPPRETVREERQERPEHTSGADPKPDPTPARLLTKRQQNPHSPPLPSASTVLVCRGVHFTPLPFPLLLVRGSVSAAAQQRQVTARLKVIIRYVIRYVRNGSTCSLGSARSRSPCYDSVFPTPLSSTHSCAYSVMKKSSSSSQVSTRQ